MVESHPRQLPIGAEDKFKGVVDLVRMKALVYKDETMGADYDIQDIPADMLEEAKIYHEKLVEKVSESDDKLLEKYLGADWLDRHDDPALVDRVMLIPDEELWAARQVRPNDTGRAYRCPGCQHEVGADVAHTVVWPVMCRKAPPVGTSAPSPPVPG